jgi:UDP-4-amino-4,6-dideoxy-N-acetyl-beta-L-altrosamine transaminase
MKISYGKQWITDEDIEKVAEVLRSDYLTTGPFVRKFESEFAKHAGAKYAVAVANGTAALHLSAQALKVKEGSQVITTPMTFAATSNCVLYNSGTPVFVDITERGLIDPDEISKHLTDSSQGLIPVHYMGLPCDLQSISSIAKENNLFVIEDASHAIGATYKKSRIGSCRYSDCTTFSFHPVKHITTGEGGIITTNDDDLYKLLLLLRTHGITKNKDDFVVSESHGPWFQEMQHLGFNYRMTDIQAALGLNQLSKVESFITRRREIAKAYFEFFEGYRDQVELIEERDYELNSYHLFVIKLVESKNRRKLFEYLGNNGVYCQVHYIPVYQHPYYREHGFKDVKLPVADDFYERIISLPMYPSLSSEELEHVFSMLRKFFKNL